MERKPTNKINRVNLEFQQLLAQLIDSPALPTAKAPYTVEQLELLNMLATDGQITDRSRTAAQKLGMLPKPTSRSLSAASLQQEPNMILDRVLPLHHIWQYLTKNEDFCIHVIQKSSSGAIISYPHIAIGPHSDLPQCVPCSKIAAEKFYKKALHSSAYAIVLAGFAARRLFVYRSPATPSHERVEVELYGNDRRIVLTSPRAKGDEQE